MSARRMTDEQIVDMVHRTIRTGLWSVLDILNNASREGLSRAALEQLVDRYAVFA